MMKRTILPLLLALVVLSISTHESWAQGSSNACPVIVETALQAVDEFCAGLERNQACYGNVLIEAEPQENVTDFVFNTNGDIVGIGDVKNLVLSGMNIEQEEWGVAVMQVQANLPDSLPGQNVSFLLFGDVALGNVVGSTATIAMTANQGINVRLFPRTDQSNVVGVLAEAEAVTAIGRYTNVYNENWIQVNAAGVNGYTGWVIDWALDADQDVDGLPVVRPGERPTYGPMQAFYFTSGIGDARCAEAPDSGILVQTPQGIGLVDFQINGVDVQLGSTAFLTAGQNENGDRLLNINMLGGRARVESHGVAQYANAGQQVSVPLDDNNRANGQPFDPNSYDGRNKNLPTGHMNNPIIPAGPYIADPSAPVILAVHVDVISPIETAEDIVFYDQEGDAAILQIEMLHSSAPVSYEFTGTQINVSPDVQMSETGGTMRRETICTSGTEDVQALFRITIIDSAGHESNVVEYRTTCGTLTPSDDAPGGSSSDNNNNNNDDDDNDDDDSDDD